MDKDTAAAPSPYQLPLVRDFYAHKEIFITGGTGYLGKVLIEKLLRSCPDLTRIYVLIRPKKGLSPAARVKLFREDQVFDRLRKENCESLQKIDYCSGDVREIGLGIDPVDFERIRRCSIVIHSAATVRFDESLTDSILMNTRGTRETLLLAQRMDNVVIFNHVSTTFCNPEHVDSEEKLYPIHVYWKDAIKLAENLHEETFDTLAKVYMNHHPNTYTFSKRLSEHLVNDFRKEAPFPIVILRPSVVTPTVEEPFPGWVDNFNGPVAVIVAICTGIHRILKTTLDSYLDYQPVDVVVKSIILSTWKEANVKTPLEEDVSIYNSSSFGKYAVTNKDILECSTSLRYETPLLNTLWYPNPTFTSSHLAYTVLTIFCVAIPTNVIDFLVRLFNLKIPFQLSRLSRKIFYVTGAVQHFMDVQMTFDNTRCMALDKDLHKEEYTVFRQDVPVTKHEYLMDCVRKPRVYLLKEDPSSIPRARRNMRIFFVLHYGLLSLFWGSVAYFCFSYMKNVGVVRAMLQ